MVIVKKKAKTSRSNDECASDAKVTDQTSDDRGLFDVEVKMCVRH